jgi:hypothetical protein
MPLFTSSLLCQTWATSQKVAGSISDGVIRIFRWHKPSGRTLALGWTQPLTEMSTRNISGGGGVYSRLVRRTENLTAIMCWLSWNLGARTSWNPQGLSRSVLRLHCLYTSFIKHHKLTACMERHSTSQLVLLRGGWTKSNGLQARSHSPTSDNPLSSHCNHTCLCLVAQSIEMSLHASRNSILFQKVTVITAVTRCSVSFMTYRELVFWREKTETEWESPPKGGGEGRSSVN